MDDVRAVMDAAGSQRAALVGVSEGGPLSLLFSATHPGRTVAMVIVATFARIAWAPTIRSGPSSSCGAVCSGISFEERGAHALKGVPGQWSLYAVTAAT